MSAPLCLCGCLRGDHQSGRGRCGACDGCSFFEPDVDAESTSARLARTENELTGVREELARQDAECEDLRATLAIRSRQIQASRRLVDELGRDLTPGASRTGVGPGRA